MLSGPREAYLAVFSLLDAEWDRWNADGGRRSKGVGLHRVVTGAFDQFKSHCDEYRVRVATAVKEWGRAAGAAATAVLPKQILRPYCFYPVCGHADAMGLVLCDDIESFNYLGNSPGRAIEEISMAICPKMRPLRPSRRWSGRVFQDLHSVIGPSRRGFASGMAKRPLLSLTRLKLSGLAGLDCAGVALELVQHALADILARTLEQMDHFQPDAAEHGIDVEREDIRGITVSFLEFNGAEELGLFITGTNPAVSMALVSAARGMLISDVFARAPAAAKMLWAEPRSNARRVAPERNPFWGLLGNLSHDRAGDFFGKARVFRWTHTFLSLATDGNDIQPALKRCRGNVEFHAEMQVAPGDQRHVEDAVTKAAKDVGLGLDPAPRGESGEPAQRRSLGLADLRYSVRQCDAGADSPDRFRVPLADVVKLKAKILDECEATVEAAPDSGLIELLGTVTVPIDQRALSPHNALPGTTNRTISGDVSEAERTLARQLRKVKQTLGDRETAVGKLRTLVFPSGDRRGRTEPLLGKRFENYIRKQGERWSLHLGPIEEIPRLYGLPRALRRTITCLYQNYLHIVGNPMLFDLVLDLNDAFATLHHLLTRALPSKLLAADTGGYYGVLNEDVVSAISEYVDALQEAFSKRLRRAYPESGVRDLSVDLRGEILGFIQAADAPLRCGAGLIRNEWRHGIRDKVLNRYRKRAEETADRNPPDPPPDRDTIGVFTHLTFRPGIRVRTFHFGRETEPTLALFETDVPHLVNVGSYIDYIHEAAHLILDDILGCPDLRDDFALLKYRDTKLMTRVQEVFAHALSFLCVCDGEAHVRAYLRYVAGHHSSAGTLTGYSLNEVFRAFAEEFLHPFLGARIALAAATNRRPSDDLAPRRRDALRRAFLGAYDDASWFFQPYHDLDRPWKRAGVRRLAWLHCEGAIGEGGGCGPEELDDIGVCVSRIFNAFKEKIEKREGCPYDELQAQLIRQISRAMAAGGPIHPFRVGAPPGRARMDPMLLTTCLLRCYIADYGRLQSGRRRAHYPRQVGVHRTHLDTDGLPYESALVDPGAAARQCLDPAERQRQLLIHICMLRSFWSLSALMRGRRFNELLSFVTPRPTDGGRRRLASD